MFSQRQRIIVFEQTKPDGTEITTKKIHFFVM